MASAPPRPRPASTTRRPEWRFPVRWARASGSRVKRWLALSAIGLDRPGIVADLAELIYECDCNLEDSSMTILGSEFAVLLLLSGQGPDVERRLSAGCKRLEWEKRHMVPMACEVNGVDKAGIVARIARTLADHGVNITALKTQSRPGPETGTPMFTMRIEMGVPLELDRRVLRERLERVAADLRVDLVLSDPGPS